MLDFHSEHTESLVPFYFRIRNHETLFYREKEIAHQSIAVASHFPSNLPSDATRKKFETPITCNEIKPCVTPKFFCS